MLLSHCCTATWLRRPNKRVAGACRLASSQPSNHALNLNITRPVMRSTKPLVKSAAAADTKLQGWNGRAPVAETLTHTVPATLVGVPQWQSTSLHIMCSSLTPFT